MSKCSIRCKFLKFSFGASAQVWIKEKLIQQEEKEEIKKGTSRHYQFFGSGKYLFGACQPAKSKSHSNLPAGKNFEQIKYINTFKIKKSGAQLLVN